MKRSLKLLIVVFFTLMLLIGATGSGDAGHTKNLPCTHYPNTWVSCAQSYEYTTPNAQGKCYEWNDMYLCYVGADGQSCAGPITVTSEIHHEIACAATPTSTPTVVPTATTVPNTCPQSGGSCLPWGEEGKSCGTNGKYEYIGAKGCPNSGACYTCKEGPTNTPSPTATKAPTATSTLTPTSPPGATATPTTPVSVCIPEGDSCAGGGSCCAALSCDPTTKRCLKKCEGSTCDEAINACVDRTTYAEPGAACTGLTCDTATCTGPTATPTPTKVPVCNRDCTDDSSVCEEAHDGCIECRDDPDGDGKTCQPPASTNTPTPTVTPTGVPACNSPCNNPSACQGAQDGCTYCNPDTDRCVRPECGTPCTIPADCEGALTCNICTDDPDSPTGKSCQAAPTATPTPLPFDESMCSCDEMAYTSLSLGSTSTITAWGKVLGVNKNYATIPSIRFRFMSGNNPADQKLIEEKKINTKIVLDTAEMVRYEAVWPLTLPSDLDTKQTYRIQAKVDCSRKIVFAPSSNTAVLAVEDENPSFWRRIYNFFANMFRFNRPEATVTPTPTAEPVSRENLEDKGLNLETLRFATNVEMGKEADNCSFIKFDFSTDK